MENEQETTTFIVQGDIVVNSESEPVCVVKVNGKVLDLEKSLKVADHSPDGFNWGYLGSGPAQTAFAILQHVFGDDFAKENTQRFKFDVIANQEIDKPFNIKVMITRNGDQGVEITSL